ncbi:MAG: nucleotide-binding protein [Candidatus Nitrosopolaris sp.]
MRYQLNQNDLILLSHFEEPVWPRTVSTYATEGRQVLVYNKDEALARFKQANLLDCRINAYPDYTGFGAINRQAPNFIFIDLDLSRFSFLNALDRGVENVLKNIKDKLNGAQATVIWPGNGYHIYLPIRAFILESESVFAEFEQPSKKFLRFSEKMLVVSPPEINSIKIVVTSNRQSAIEFEQLQDVTSQFITVRPEITAALPQKEVFIVHGHDDAAKNELSSFLFRPGLKPIILHEQPNNGKAVIEKFEQYASKVGYAFVLLTPDDIGGKDRRNLSERARQNVILELGYFMAKLGRDKVCGLYKGNVELPSDVLGVLYLKYENSIQERAFDISQELSSNGYKITLRINQSSGQKDI